MEINSNNLKLGISVGNFPAEYVKRFVDCGFTHFEVGIPARLPDPNPLVKTPAERRINPYNYEESKAISCRNEEHKLVALRQQVIDAVCESNGILWSIHLPFGGGWDIANADENLRKLAVDGMFNVINLTAKYKPQVYVVHTCLEPVSDDERALRMKMSAKSLSEIKQYTDKLGIRLAVENLPRSCLGNNTDEMQVLTDSSGVPICFDVNHLLQDSHERFLDKLGNRIITTHLSDYDGTDERHWLPGRGVVPWKMLAERLLDSGYSGPFLFELSKVDDRLAEPEEILDAFKKSLAK